MTNPISLKRNFLMNAILTMSSFIFPLITFKYVSTILLPIGTGKVSLATSLISYFTMFSQLGIPTYGVRACALVRDDRESLSRTVHELLHINLIMCIFTYAVYFLALFFVPRLQEERLLYSIMSVTIVLNAIGIEWLYKGLEQYTYITIRSLAFKVIAMVAMFMLIHEQKDYIIYGVITIFAASASNIMNFFHAKRFVQTRAVGKLEYRKHFRAIGVFFAMSCAATVYTHLDVVMLGFMTTDTDVGYYNAAVRIKQILVSIVTSLGTVLLPRASYHVEKGELEAFHRITQKALNFVWIFATPIMIYFMIFSAQGIFFLSSSAYSEAIRPMQVIMPTLLFIGLTNIMGLQVLVPLGKEKIVLYSEITGAIVDLILNAILIPKYRAMGAAIGTLAAEFVVLLFQYQALKSEGIEKYFKDIHYKNIIIGIVLATFGTVWTKHLYEGSSTTLESFIVLCTSAVFFFGIYVLFMTIHKEELVLEMEKTVMKMMKK